MLNAAQISYFPNIRPPFFSVLIIYLMLSTTHITSAGAAETRIGWATYYTEASSRSEGTSGAWTASGRPYHDQDLICALPIRYPYRSLLWGRHYRVTNIATGKSVIVRHYDYGPGRRARGRGVIVDLSPAAWSALGAHFSAGRIKIVLEPMP